MNGLALFAGGAGLELGLRLALGEAYRTVCYVEREAYAAATLVARMRDGALDDAPVWDDVSTFDGRPWRGVVDLVSGGFPCQDISVAGKRAGIGGERSGLWYEFARIVGDVRPRYVFVENVAALALGGLDEVLASLALLGFDAEWGTVAAEDVGAPHGRDRIFLLAHAHQWGREGQRLGGLLDGQRTPLGDNPDGRDRARGVEHAESVGRREGWAEPALLGRTTLADRAACAVSEVADTDNRGFGEQQERFPRSCGAARSALRGVALGDPEHEQREEVPAGAGGRTPVVGAGAGAAGRDGGRGAPAGVPERVRTDGGDEADLPIWPPGPEDRDAWGYVVDRAPHLEPAVRRVADGLAYRVDRLRLAGNGVVPLAAAVAFCVLWDRLMGFPLEDAA